MAKFKTTMKAIKNAYAPKYIWRVGYCDLQNLFTGLEPRAYTCGVRGWNFDLYEIEGVAITTGYRGMMGELVPSELIAKYEQLASDLNSKQWELKHDDRMNQLEQLRKNFVKELYQNK